MHSILNDPQSPLFKTALPPTRATQRRASAPSTRSAGQSVEGPHRATLDSAPRLNEHWLSPKPFYTLNCHFSGKGKTLSFALHCLFFAVKASIEIPPLISPFSKIAYRSKKAWNRAKPDFNFTPVHNAKLLLIGNGLAIPVHHSTCKCVGLAIFYLPKCFTSFLLATISPLWDKQNSFPY